MDTDTMVNSEGPSARSGCKLFLIVFAAVLVALLVAALALKWWLFPAQLQPVELRAAEKIELNQKLRVLGYQDDAFPEVAAQPVLEPQAYSEEGASREVRFKERELNALLAKNTELASKLAIDLSDQLASARLVLPLDPDFPFVGGQTLRMSAGVEVAFRQQRPVIVLQGVSLWGVPLPNAWLGNLKNVDLVERFGQQQGFWEAFAEGVEHIEVLDGELRVKLRE